MKQGYLVLTTSPLCNMVKLSLNQKINDKFKEKNISWYGKDVELMTTWTTNKGKMKKKFQNRFRNMMYTPTLFNKAFLSEYVQFIHTYELNQLCEDMEMM